jgi:glyoxylase-like metal-dependent hydrolase (beta-lactamase superfamily II)
MIAGVNKMALGAIGYYSQGKVAIEGGALRYENWIVDQLAAMNMTPADISHAAYSHLHFDHAGAANAFIESEVLMQQTEWDAAFAAGNRRDLVDRTRQGTG